MRIAITGASGFVGSHLARKLLRGEIENEVYGLIRRRADSSASKNLLNTDLLDHSRFHVVTGDITNYYSIIKFLQESQPDVIFHLASQSFVPESTLNPLATYETTLQGTLNLLEAMRNICSDKTRMVFAGSSEEYGAQFDSQSDYVSYIQQHGNSWSEPHSYPETPINEDNVLRPQSPYAVAKAAADFACRNYAQTYGLKTIVHRCFNVEGAGRGHHFVTASIVRQMVQYKLGEVDRVRVGNIESKRDWSHVDDIVDAYILLGQRGRAGEVYVSGSGKQYSIIDFINIVREKLQSPGLVTTRDHSLYRKTDVTNLLADPTKIKALGWSPKKDIRDIITDMIHYYLVKEHRVNILG